MANHYIYINGVKEEWVEVNGTHIHEVYVDGHFVYDCAAYLYLPASGPTVNLRTFIDAAGIDTRYHRITIYNEGTRGKVITGDLSGYTPGEIHLINNGEIQANAAAGNALELTTKLKLTNNGFIRGGGGQGGNGGNGSSYSRTVSVWGDPRGYNSKDCTSTVADPGQSHMRGWNSTTSAPFAKQAFWSDKTCTKVGIPYNIPSQTPVWGDQGMCFTDWFGFIHRPVGGHVNNRKIALDGVIDGGTNSITGTTGGNGGVGVYYGHAAELGSTGTTGTVSGANNGFNDSNGKNYTPYGASTNQGGTGGAGGYWGSTGGTGNSSRDGKAGSSGTTGGKSITGTNNLTNGIPSSGLSGGTTP